MKTEFIAGVIILILLILVATSKGQTYIDTTTGSAQFVEQSGSTYYVTQVVPAQLPPIQLPNNADSTIISSQGSTTIVQPDSGGATITTINPSINQ